MKLHDARKQPKRFKWYVYLILFFQNNLKLIKKFSILLIILSVIFLPTISGEIIGNWIKDFFGTIINIIKTI